jgi:hypothetical protein
MLPALREVNASLKEAYELFEDPYALRVLSTHVEARRILADCYVSGRPFALYLRNFSREAMRSSVMERVGPVRVDFATLATVYTSFQPDHLQGKLVGALLPFLPVVGIRNPQDLIPGFEQHDLRAPMLDIPESDWVEVLEQLVSSAHLIVAVCEHESLGIQLELETIRRLGRADSTVIVLPEPLSDEERETRRVLSLVVASFGDGSPPFDPSGKRKMLELWGFGRVLREAEVPFDALQSSPAFAEILRRRSA